MKKKIENNEMNIFERVVIILAIFLSIFGICGVTFFMKDILFPEFKSDDEISYSQMRIHKEAVIYEVKCDE